MIIKENLIKTEQISSNEWKERLNRFIVFCSKLENNFDYRLIKEKYFELELSFLFRPISVPNKDYEFWRVRSGIDSNNENIQTLKPFKAPDPKLFQVKMDRANRPNFPVFYCSEKPQTAILESKFETNTYHTIFLSKWKIKQNVKFSALPFSLYHSENINGISTHKLLIDYLKIGLRNYGVENHINHIKLYNTFVDAFLDENNYQLSSWLAHEVLYNSQGFDCISYPSIQTNKWSTNFAFLPHFQESNMELEIIYQINHRESSKELFTLDKAQLIKVGSFINQKIKWLDVKGETEGDNTLKQIFSS
jgi:hypothetical protein